MKKIMILIKCYIRMFLCEHCFDQTDRVLKVCNDSHMDTPILACKKCKKERVGGCGL